MASQIRSTSDVERVSTQLFTALLGLHGVNTEVRLPSTLCPRERRITPARVSRCGSQGLESRNSRQSQVPRDGSYTSLQSLYDGRTTPLESKQMPLGGSHSHKGSIGPPMLSDADVHVGISLEDGDHGAHCFASVQRAIDRVCVCCVCVCVCELECTCMWCVRGYAWTRVCHTHRHLLVLFSRPGVHAVVEPSSLPWPIVRAGGGVGIARHRAKDLPLAGIRHVKVPNSFVSPFAVGSSLDVGGIKPGPRNESEVSLTAEGVAGGNKGDHGVYVEVISGSRGESPAVQGAAGMTLTVRLLLWSALITSHPVCADH
jgi:hypothetical protein